MNSNVNFYIILMSHFNNNTFPNTNHYSPERTTELPPESSKFNFAIWLIVFSAAILLFVLTTLMIGTICCKYHRRRESDLFGHSASVASIQELIRARLQDRPPTYYESQSSLEAAHTEEPPTYQEIVETGVIVEPTVFIISSKRIMYDESNDDSLTFVEDDSDSDAPPSYYSAEGVVNSIMQERNNNHTVDYRNIVEFEQYGNPSFSNNMFHI